MRFPKQPRPWIAAAVLLLGALAAGLGIFETFDLKLLDQGFRLRRGAPDSGQVVLIGIDEGTCKTFPEPMSLWHRHLGDAFRGLAVSDAKAVGLDLNLPDRSFDALIPGMDAALMGGIVMLKRTCPLVLGVTIEGNRQPREVHPPMLAVAGPEGIGYVLWFMDSDRFVRRYDERLDERLADKPLPTLAGSLARQLGLRTGQGYLDFSVGQPYAYVPLQDVVAWAREGRTDRLKAAFQGKVVFIGSVLPLVDRHFMPLNLAGWEENHGAVPGVLLHAQAMRCFLGPGLVRSVHAWILVVLSVAMAGLVWWAARRPVRGILALAGAALVVGAASYLLLGRSLWLPPVAPLFAGALALVARTSLEAALKLQERMRLRRVFGGYVSPAILKEILDGRLQPGLQGERRTLCLLFSDIRSFTTLSESMDPEDVIALLNRYFSRMAEAIHRHGGTLDKFIGDGIMAFFGAPEPHLNPCPKAFAAAQAMLASLDELNAELEREGRPTLKIGIGLHFGEAAVGHVGSEARHEYTAIGDVVNTASRIEGLTKDAGYPLLVTHPVFEHLPDQAEFDALGEKPLKGRSAMAVYGWPKR